MCRNEKQEGCRKHGNLTGKPQDCSHAQIRECHGDTDGHLCVETAGCEHPERLKGKPVECSPVQIRQCHGDAAEHRCASK